MIFDNCYIGYLNLDERKDRLFHIQAELSKHGIQAERTRGKLPHEYDLNNPKWQVMKNRRAGAIGCHLGQVEIMKKAVAENKHAFVLEDDVVFCSDWNDRIKLIEDFLKSRDWQIFWFGGTYHVNGAWWHRIGHNRDLQKCNCTLGVDAEKTDDKRFVRTYGAFSTHAYIVNNKFIEKLLIFLEENVHLSMGIDWLMILLQPNIYSYAFVPGCIKQMDNMSNIGDGITVFSGFSRLGNHWYQDKMSDFDYDNFNIC